MDFLRRDHAVDAACGIGCYFQIMHRHDLKITFLCRVFCGFYFPCQNSSGPAFVTEPELSMPLY